MSVAEAVASFRARQEDAVHNALYNFVLELVVERATLRAVKRWDEADAVRDKLNRFGIEVKEDKIGCHWSVVGGGWNAGGYIITDLKTLVDMERERLDNLDRKA